MCNHPDLLRLKGGKADDSAEAQQLDGMFPAGYTPGAPGHSGTLPHLARQSCNALTTVAHDVSSAYVVHEYHTMHS